MDKEEFIKKVKELAVDFWTMNLHNGTFEDHLLDIVNEREEAINYTRSYNIVKQHSDEKAR